MLLAVYPPVLSRDALMRKNKKPASVSMPNMALQPTPQSGAAELDRWAA